MDRVELEKLLDSGVLQDTPDLQLWEQELQDLVNKGFLQHLSQQDLYTFSNNLTWEVVYETLLFAERRRLHNLIAEHIEINNENKLDSVASLLLHHYEKADNYPKVVYFGAKAGDRAGTLFANEDAITLYNSALSALEKLDAGLITEKCLFLEHIGDIHDVAGQFKEAIDAYQEALQVWLNKEKIKKPEYVSWKFKSSTYESLLCRKLAVVNERSSEYEAAFMWLNSAEQSLPERAGIVKAQILSTRSAVHYRKGEFKDAIKYGRDAVNIARKLKAKKDLVYAINALANSYIAMGQYKKAIDQITKAIEICEKEEDFPGMAISYYNLGSCQANMGNLNAAEESYRKVLAMDEKMHNTSAIAMDYAVIGNVLTSKGSYDDAIDYLTKVVKLYEKGKSRPDLTGVVLSKLCTLYIEKNEQQKAEESVIYGLKLLREVGAKAHIFRGELQLAELKCQLGELIEAEQICRNVLAEMDEAENANIASTARIVLGDVLLKMERYEDAAEQYDRSASLAKSIKKDILVAQALHNKAKSLLKAGRANSETLRSLDDVMEIYRKSNAVILLKDAEELYEKIQASL